MPAVLVWGLAAGLVAAGYKTGEGIGNALPVAVGVGALYLLSRR